MKSERSKVWQIECGFEHLVNLPAKFNGMFWKVCADTGIPTEGCSGAVALLGVVTKVIDQRAGESFWVWNGRHNGKRLMLW